MNPVSIIDAGGCTRRPAWRRHVRRAGGAIRRVLGQEGFACLMRPAVRLRRCNVVMFHIGRSGSTVLGDLLRQHWQVFWDGEVLDGYYGAALEERSRVGSETRSRWNASVYYPDDLVGFLRSRMPLAGIRKCYGIEIKFFHLTFNNWEICRFLEVARQLGFSHFIVLERQNWLRKIVSSIVAQRKNVFHQTVNSQAEPTKVILDVKRICIDGEVKPLMAYFDEWTRKFATLRRLLSGDRILELSYERDIEDNPITAYVKCCNFLEIEPFLPEVRLGKTNPFPLDEIVDNWDEVLAALQGTVYEWMLNPKH